MHASNLMKNKNIALFTLLSNDIKTQECVGQKTQSKLLYKRANVLKSMKLLRLWNYFWSLTVE